MNDHLGNSVAVAILWFGAVLMLTQVSAAEGRQIGELADPMAKHVTFKATISPSDPFSELNETSPRKGAKFAVQRGETFVVTITGTVEKGWHTYPLTKRAPRQIESQLSKLSIEGGASFQLVYPIRESEPEWRDDRKDANATDPEALADIALEHARPFTWVMEVYVKPTAPADQIIQLPIKIQAQVCNKSCIVENHDITVPVTVGPGPALAPSPTLQKRLAIKEPAPEVVQFPAEFKITAKPPANSPPGSSDRGTRSAGSDSPMAKSSMLGAVLQAIIGGFVALLTPCVFPMIPITVSFFLKQAERRRSPAFAGTGASAVAVLSEEEPKGYPPLLLAAIYSGTIVLILSAGGLLLLGVLQQIIAHYITNFFLSAVFLFFALSLLGMYDISLPSWLQDRTAARESRGGLIGVVFMAITFSIVSFACVGPIYGGFITLGATDQSTVGHYWKAVPPVLGFSVAFASPFFLLALFPTLMRTMPRAGSWMNSVKVVIGFLELAAAVKFLRTSELVLTKTSTFFTFDLCLGIYVALAFACGLYLLGIYRLPHDHEAPESISVPRLGFSLMFITLGLYMLPGLFKTAEGDAQRPNGTIYAWVESFLLPETDGPKSIGSGSGSVGSSQKLVWHHKLKEALAQAKLDNKLVFVDITGIACTNCRLNERDAFPRSEVQTALSKLVLLKLYAEAGVPAGIEQQPNSDETIHLRNTFFETNSLPVYALLKPKDDNEQGFEIVRKISGSDSGLISDIPAFVKALSVQ